MDYFFEKWFSCTHFRITKSIVNNNITQILHENIASSLTVISSSTDITSKTSMIRMHCDKSNGEISSLSSVTSFENDPNITLMIYNIPDKIYVFYSNGGLSYNAIRMLTQTEKTANMHRDDAWRKLLKKKVEKIKFKYGLYEAMMWNSAYKETEERYTPYTTMELIKL